MSEKKYIFAIDHGTSAVKIALVDVCGEVLAWDWEDTDVYLSPGGAAEQDPDEWWSALVKASQRILSKNIADLASVLKPSISVIDGVIAGEGHENSGNPVEMNLVIVATDPVAVDSVGAAVMGILPKKVKVFVPI